MEKTDIGTHVKEIVKNKKSIPGEINLLLLEPCIQCGSDDPTFTITYSDTSLVKANISVTCNNCGRSIKLHGVTFCDIRKEWNIITEKNILINDLFFSKYSPRLSKEISTELLKYISDNKLLIYAEIDRQNQITSIYCKINDDIYRTNNTKFKIYTNEDMLTMFLNQYRDIFNKVL